MLGLCFLGIVTGISAPTAELSFLVLIISEQKCVVLNWNVRGLNNKARRKVVKDLVSENRCTIAALQETKMEVLTAETVTETLGVKFSKHFAYLPAQGTRGGALVAVDEDYYNITQSAFRAHTVTVKVESKQCNSDWWLTVVYGPQGDRKDRIFARIERHQGNGGRQMAAAGGLQSHTASFRQEQYKPQSSAYGGIQEHNQLP